jgi:hypothetical protein
MSSKKDRKKNIPQREGEKNNPCTGDGERGVDTYGNTEEDWEAR